MKKTLLVIFLALLCILVTLLIIYFNLPRKISVITYHNLTNDDSSSMNINIDEFEKQVSYLAKHNYYSLTLKEVECYLDGSCSIPRKSVLITFDDGWKNNLTMAFPILKKYNLNATLFYIGNNYDGHNSNFINSDDLEIIRRDYKNIEIASHTYDLHVEDAYKLSVEELKNDMKKMKEIIDSPYIAYPYGHHSDNYHKALEEEGYKLAFTFGPDGEHRKLSRSDNKYELPRLNMSDGMPFWKFVLRLIWIY